MEYLEKQEKNGARNHNFWFTDFEENLNGFTDLCKIFK
jgi:hypothetical protein